MLRKKRGKGIIITTFFPDLRRIGRTIQDKAKICIRYFENVGYIWIYVGYLDKSKSRYSCLLLLVSSRSSHQIIKNMTILSTGGAISSDLYRPQSQDEIVEFSFFVVLSYESNLQLGCFWWKISTSSLKTFFLQILCLLL